MRLGLAAASLLLAFALAELLARTTGLPSAPIALEEFAAAVEAGHGTNFERIFRWDRELLWRLAANVSLPEDERPFFGLVSNAQGLREDHPIPRGAHPGELRILCLGDSVTFGYLVQQDRTFVELLERDLAARFPALGIECINAGVPGYTLVQGLRYLELEGLGLEPDLVLLNFGWNERATWSGGGDLERLEQHRRLPEWLAWSRVLERVLANEEPGADDAGPPRARVTPEEFRAELERACRLCAEHGIALALLVGPGRFNLGQDEKKRTYYQIQQYQVGKEIELEAGSAPALVDGVEVFRALAREHTADELFFDGVHPTELGHEALGRRLAEVLGEALERRSKDG